MSIGDENYDEGHDPGRPETLGESAARERTTLPGIFLIVVGLLNLLASVALLGVGYMVLTAPPEKIQEFWEKLTEEQKEQMKQGGIEQGNLQQTYANTFLRWGGVALLGSILTLAGGIQLRARRSYWLAMVGAVLAAIPCLSPLGCCLVGEGIGIWCLVVLLNPDVKSSFQ